MIYCWYSIIDDNILTSAHEYCLLRASFSSMSLISTFLFACFTAVKVQFFNLYLDGEVYLHLQLHNNYYAKCVSLAKTTTHSEHV